MAVDIIMLSIDACRPYSTRNSARFREILSAILNDVIRSPNRKWKPWWPEIPGRISIYVQLCCQHCVCWWPAGTVMTKFVSHTYAFNSLRPRQNGRHIPDDHFKRIFLKFFLNEMVWISLKISLKCVPKVRINNIPALVQIMAWCRPGDKPLSEPVLFSLLTQISVTRPQWGP